MIVYDINDKKVFDTILTDSAEHEQELSKSDFVRLSWESDMKLTIPAGAYIVPFEDGLKYRLLNAYTPSETDKGFKYDISFHHPLMWLSRVPFLYVENDLKQQEWSFEGLTVTALEYVCKAINEAFGITDDAQKFTYTLCGTVDGSVSFSVSSNDILSVLSSIAQACKDNNCEWHLSWEHHCLYFGQIAINLGEEVPVLKVHDNIQTASVSESKEDYYNCFYPQGSTKNMSRKAQVGTGNVATLARLGLDMTKYPDGCVYVGIDGKVITKAEFDESNAIKQTLALSFDDIFPHIDLYAYNIRKRTRYLKNDTTGEYELDSNGNKKIYTVWYMRLAYCTTTKDDSKILVNTTTDKDEQGKTVTHYWYDYDLDVKKQVLQGYTLKGTFKVNTHTTNNQYDALTQSLVGQPNGQNGFELHYHEINNPISASEQTGDSGVSVLKGDYEIVKYQSGNTIIPSNEEDGLIPHGKALPDLTCNIVVLFNIVMGEYETKLAQEELAAHTIREIIRRRQDTNNYTTRSNAVEFARKNPNLYVGQKVIYDDGFGYQLSTRVIKIVTKLDYPNIQEITVGNQAIKGTISQLKEDVKNILSGNFNGSGLNATQISDIVRNYTTQRFLSKTSEDVAQKLITFLEGVLIGNEGYRLRPNGDAVLGKITSLVYDAVTQQGFGIEKGKNGYKLSITDIEVWGKAIFNNLELRKLSYVGGNYSFSPAGSKIVYVKWIDAQGNITTDINQTSAFRCYMATDDGTTTTRNLWEVGDQARCQEFDIKEGNHHGTSNRGYWRLVVGKSSEAEELTDIMGTPIYTDKKFEWIDLSKSDASAPTDDFPKAGDTIVARGNRNNPLRQGFIDINTHGENAPSIVVYSGVKSYQLNDGNVTALLSPSDIRLSAEKLKMLSSDGRFSSFLEMTRNEISLSLRDFGGTNMLHGSSFMGELPPLNSFSQPFACNRAVLGDDDAKKHLGRNYIKIEETGNNEDLFSGIFHHVNVEPGETYTASVWLMSENNASIDGTGFTIEVLKMANGERVKPNALIGYHYTTPKENSVWERAVYTFVVPDDIKEVGVNFWLPRNGHIYVSEPQLERGTIATDWSEHPDDIKTQVVKAGVNLKDGTLNLSGENIIVDNGNETPTAMFKDGKMRAELIDVGKLLAGEIDAKHAIIHNLTLTGFMKRRAFHVNIENFYTVTHKVEYKGRSAYQVDFTKTGSFVVFDYLPEEAIGNSVYLLFPSVTAHYGAYMTRSKFRKIIPVMELVGSSAIIVNNSRSNNMYLSGCFIGDGMELDRFNSPVDYHEDDPTWYYSDRIVLQGGVASLECKWNATGGGANGSSDMYIYWEFNQLLTTSG